MLPHLKLKEQKIRDQKDKEEVGIISAMTKQKQALGAAVDTAWYICILYCIKLKNI